jgi:hypothetical protein
VTASAIHKDIAAEVQPVLRFVRALAEHARLAREAVGSRADSAPALPDEGRRAGCRIADGNGMAVRLQERITRRLAGDTLANLAKEAAEWPRHSI